MRVSRATYSLAVVNSVCEHALSVGIHVHARVGDGGLHDAEHRERATNESY